jgi:hypothetical protein
MPLVLTTEAMQAVLSRSYGTGETAARVYSHQWEIAALEFAGCEPALHEAIEIVEPKGEKFFTPDLLFAPKSESFTPTSSQKTIFSRRSFDRRKDFHWSSDGQA